MGAQPRPALRRGVERIEDAREVFSGNPLPCVSHLDDGFAGRARFARRVTPCADDYTAVTLDGLYAVEDEVERGVFDAGGVNRQHECLLWMLEDYFDAVARGGGVGGVVSRH
jgi:hypothetical protein